MTTHTFKLLKLNSWAELGLLENIRTYSRLRPYMIFSMPYSLIKRAKALRLSNLVSRIGKIWILLGRFNYRDLKIFPNFSWPTVILGPTFIIFAKVFQTLRLFPALHLFRSLENIYLEDVRSNFPLPKQSENTWVCY